MDNKALYKLSYGLFVLTATDGQKDNGCIVNTAIHSNTLVFSLVVMLINLLILMTLKELIMAYLILPEEQMPVFL